MRDPALPAEASSRALDRLLPIGALWLGLRLLLSLGAALASTIRPMTPLEQTVSLWPPATPLPLWGERLLLAPWLRWDVEYYLAIATRGYQAGDGTAQFHPLYPWLGGAAGALLGGQPLLGLLLVSSVSALLCFVAFERLAGLDLSPAQARRATVAFALVPPSFILFAPYSESLFLLWSILALWMARTQRWGRAGLAGGLAALTRQQGLFLLLPLAWEWWDASRRRGEQTTDRWRTLLCLLLVPGGYLFWIVYRAVALRDVGIDLSQPQTLIYSLLISKSSAQVVPVQGFVPPWEALAAALRSLGVAGSHTTVIDLLLGGSFLWLLALGWRGLARLRPSYLLYTLLILWVSFSYYTGPRYPYMGLPRHCLLAFPLFLTVGEWDVPRPLRWLFLLAGVSVMMLLVLFYTLESWVP